MHGWFQGPDESPNDIHTPIAAHSLRLGQFALLVKKDGSIEDSDDTVENIADDKLPCDNNPSDNKHGLESSELQQQPKNEKKQKVWPCRENDEWCPPSCSIPLFNKGTIHSCSDKLSRWNCLGLQGSLLASVLNEPLYMTTLTVGRKFSRAICQRAVCCRAEGFRKPRREQMDVAEESKYRLNHPVLMETNVYIDETGE